MAAVHLVPTPEEFAVYVRETYGPDAVLHPANRITSCGRHMSGLDVTTRPGWVTCKTCAKSAP